MMQERQGFFLPFGVDTEGLVGRDLWERRVGIFTESLDEYRFGGLNRDELVDVVTWVANKIGIKDTEVPNIEVIFGDDFKQTHARTYMFFDENEENQRVLGCSVVINRAREIVEPVISTLKEKIKAGEVALFRDEVRTVSEAKIMVAVEFEEPWELVWWIIAEELKHAKDFLRAENKVTLDRWQTRMGGIKERYEIHSCEGVIDVMELSASRTCARLLAKVCAARGDTDRANYFLEKHRQSQVVRDVIYTDISKVWEQVFVPIVPQ